MGGGGGEVERSPSVQLTPATDKPILCISQEIRSPCISCQEKLQLQNWDARWNDESWLSRIGVEPHETEKKGQRKSKIEMAEASDAMRCCDLPAVRPARAPEPYILKTPDVEMVMKGRRASLGEAERRDKLRGGDVEKEKPRSSCPLSSASLHPVCICARRCLLAAASPHPKRIRS